MSEEKMNSVERITAKYKAKIDSLTAENADLKKRIESQLVSTDTQKVHDGILKLAVEGGLEQAEFLIKIQQLEKELEKLQEQFDFYTGNILYTECNSCHAPININVREWVDGGKPKKGLKPSYAQLQSELAAALALLSKEPEQKGPVEKCKWEKGKDIHTYHVFWTNCKKKIYAAAYYKNDYKFCPYCGREIKLKQSQN